MPIIPPVMVLYLIGNCLLSACLLTFHDFQTEISDFRSLYFIHEFRIYCCKAAMVSPMQKQQDIIITVYQKTFQSTVWGHKVSNKSKRCCHCCGTPYMNGCWRTESHCWKGYLTVTLLSLLIEQGLQSCNLLFHLCRLFPRLHSTGEVGSSI